MWCIARGIGVYKGNPLNVRTRSDLGFSLSSSSITINHLLYADDVCVVRNSPAGRQLLLDLVHQCLKWAQLKAKVTKCCSLVIQALTGKRVSTHLLCRRNHLSVKEDDSFKSLGMPIRVYRNKNSTQLQLHLQWKLSIITENHLTPGQKLRHFKQGVCPRLS